jgi:hypothetical protein
MRSLIAIVALGFAATLVVPAVAQMKEPKTKAECAKAKDMMWDAKTKKCVKKK